MIFMKTLFIGGPINGKHLRIPNDAATWIVDCELHERTPYDWRPMRTFKFATYERTDETTMVYVEKSKT